MNILEYVNKAQLVKLYIDNIEWFDNIEINSIIFKHETYAAIAQTVSGKLISQEF